jgi:hypothetical protein
MSAVRTADRRTWPPPSHAEEVLDAEPLSATGVVTPDPAPAQPAEGRDLPTYALTVNVDSLVAESRPKPEDPAMKTPNPACILLLLLALPAAGIHAQDLDEHLQLMKPFTGKVWESQMEGLRGEGSLTNHREWSVVWGGKAIKYSSRTEKLNLSQEGYFFWDPDKQEIGMFTLNSEGRFQQGYVKEEGGKILMYGFLTMGDRRLEYRNYFELTEDGRMLDSWYRFEDGEWKAGHAVELHQKNE